MAATGGGRMRKRGSAASRLGYSGGPGPGPMESLSRINSRDSSDAGGIILGDPATDDEGSDADVQDPVLEASGLLDEAVVELDVVDIDDEHAELLKGCVALGRQ
jgi:hypothetical protein